MTTKNTARTVAVMRQENSMVIATQATRSTASLGPVRASERIDVIDALRGFALAGVLFANLFAFSGFIMLSQEQQAALPGGAANGIVAMLANVFVNRKFITIFSLLFGLGFGIQLARARARGEDVVPTYARRLLVLLVIGLLHKFLLWGGDILTLYALLGFALLLVRDWPDRRLLLAGSIIALAALPVDALVKVVTNAPIAAWPPGWDTAMVSAMADGSWAEVFRLNAEYEIYRHVHDIIPYVGFLGIFLIGYWTARRSLLIAEHGPALRRVCRWGFAVGLVATVGAMAGLALSGIGRGDGPPAALPWWMPLAGLSWTLSFLGLAAAYASGFVLLFQRPRWRRLLSVFTPVGRMALTNYLLQTVIALWLFYGFMPGPGWSGKVGPALLVPILVVVFAAQIGFSAWWLRRYRFGPVEWLWRSLTYGRLQPMRRVEPARQPLVA
jgi:uncharacterized protein